MELLFARAGGLLLAGTDPTGGGGVIPGYSDQRQVELLVGQRLHAARGDQDLHAERRHLPRPRKHDRIDRRRQTGRPRRDRRQSAANIADIRKVEMVFKQGVAYDPAKLIASVKGKVGLF